MWLGQAIQTFCRTQDTISLSSAEAELKATCKGMAEGIALQELASFLNQSRVPLEHMGDAAAALGILKRYGAGGIKHLTVKQRWVQDAIRRPYTSTVKIPRHLNLADALCSAQCTETLRTQMARMGYSPHHASSEGVRSFL